MGLAVAPNGNVYVSNRTGTEKGIYLIGNTSTATLTKTLAVGDRVVDFVILGINVAATGAGLDFDIAGNMYLVDNGQEAIHAYTPGGVTSFPVTGPTSQTFAVTGSNVSDWGLY